MRDLAGQGWVAYDRRGVAQRKRWKRRAAIAAKHGACVGALRWIKGTTVCEGPCTCFKA